MLQLGQQKTVMACITAQESCRLIIENAKAMAKHIDANVEVVTAQPKQMEAFRRAEDMRCLDQLSKETGRYITVIYSDNPLISLVNYAQRQNPLHIFTGKQDEESDFVMRLSVLTGAPITMVANGLVCTLPPMLEQKEAR